MACDDHATIKALCTEVSFALCTHGRAFSILTLCFFPLAKGTHSQRLIVGSTFLLSMLAVGSKIPVSCWHLEEARIRRSKKGNQAQRQPVSQHKFCFVVRVILLGKQARRISSLASSLLALSATSFVGTRTKARQSLLLLKQQAPQQPCPMILLTSQKSTAFGTSNC